jgi:1-acyl-sn-glycerol-3-phosphate acyltransferase
VTGRPDCILWRRRSGGIWRAATGRTALNDGAHGFDAAGDLTDTSSWEPPGFAAMLRWPAPHMALRDRLLFRSLAALATLQLTSVRGLEHIAPDRDPFILAPNHATRGESILVPSLFFVLRGGKLIHFLATWNFRIIPGIGLIYRRARVVTVARKDSKPKFLNVFRQFYKDPVPAMERAQAHLVAGRSIGIFPEGTVNRNPRRLLIGRLGMARLSLETGVPVVPVGIRFPDIDRDRPTPENAAMAIEIGAPMTPPAASSPPTAGEVRRWHAAVMGEIARLSGKAWGK